MTGQLAEAASEYVQMPQHLQQTIHYVRLGQRHMELKEAWTKYTDFIKRVTPFLSGNLKDAKLR